MTGGGEAQSLEGSGAPPALRRVRPVSLFSPVGGFFISRSSKSRSEGEGDRTTELRFRDLSALQRTLVLVFFWVLVPAAALAVVEAGLRIAEYGEDPPLFLPHPSATEYRYPNPEVGRRYTLDPGDAARPHNDLFRARKPADAFRIVVQGASAAAGFPYYFGGAFSRMLEARLAGTFPDRTIEVVNVALDATSSHTLLDLSDEILDEEPDAVLVYAGHNEYYGLFGVASTQSLGREPALVRTYLRLRRLRLMQLLGRGILRARSALAEPAEGGGGTLMERLAGERAVRYGSPLFRAGLDQYRENLDRLLARYREAGVPVFLGTVGSNERDLPPFRSVPDPEASPEEWEDIMGEAARAEEAGRLSEALARLDDAVATDSTAPLPFFRKGRILEARGSAEDARRAYRLARDRDQLPFRAPSRLNRTLRNLASRHGATVVETEERLARASPNGILGGELFLEHVHPNIEGQFLLADAFYDALLEEELPAEPARRVPPREARERVPVTVVDSLAGEYWIQRLTARWPFRERGGGVSPVPPDTATPADPVEEIALRLYRREIPWPDATLRLIRHYRSVGELERAYHASTVLVQEMPQSEVPHLSAGQVALLLGRDDRALHHLRTANERRPTEAAHRVLAGIRAARGEEEQARRHLRRVGELADDPGTASLAIRALEVLPDLRSRTEEEPESAGAWADLGGAYYLTGQLHRAREAVDRALELDPRQPGAREIQRGIRELMPGSAGELGRPPPER